jgi:hypothetical protein
MSHEWPCKELNYLDFTCGKPLEGGLGAAFRQNFLLKSAIIREYERHRPVFQDRFAKFGLWYKIQCVV